jgi:ligand-binding sensor domain-containing protein/signal transduction histidine kinase
MRLANPIPFLPLVFGSLQPTFARICFAQIVLLTACSLFLCCRASSNDRELHPLEINSRGLIGHDIRFTRVSTRDGLSQSRVEHIVQDDQGFMWFGTSDGLNRYDGYSFKVFKHNRYQENSLGGVEVKALFKDRSGKLWIGVDQLLDRFDPATETFTHYRTDPRNSSSLGGEVYGICQDASGFVWLATNHGLARLDPASGVFTHYYHSANDSATLSGDNLTSVMIDKTGLLWVVSTVGLDTVNPQTRHINRYVEFQGSLKFALHPDIALRPDIKLYEDRTGELWVSSTAEVGLVAFDRGTRTFTICSFRHDNPDARTVAGITAISEDAEGILWLATVGNGLIRFDSKRRAFARYMNKPGVATSLSNDFVLSLFLDQEGNIWAGTGGGGVNRFRGSEAPFLTYRKEPANPNSLNQNYILSVYEDRQGILWIGNDGVLNRLDRTAGRYAFYRHNPANSSSISDGTVTSAAEDRSGTLWFGTYAGGLNKFDRAKGTFKSFRHSPSDSQSLSSDRILTMLMDRAGALWIGAGSILDRFDRINQRFIAYVPPRPSPISQIVEDRDGSLWLGTVDQGLNHFIPATGEFTSFPDPESTGSLGSNHINALCFDHTGTLWIGTEYGLSRFDTKSHRVIISFYQQNGLPSNVVQGIQEDAHDNLWVSTNGGLAMLDPRTNEITRYYDSDGIAGNDFGVLFPVAYKSPGGEMFFGGVDGVTAFYPDDVVRALKCTFVPPVVLTDFLLSNEPAAIGGASPLEKAINYTGSLVLSHKENVFSLEFSALSYVSSSTTRYRYKIEGLQKDWYETDSNRRFVTYTTLPHGDYTFRVQAAVRRAGWNAPGTSLHITILPPWWVTWWFKTMYITAAALGLLGFYFYRLRQIQHEYSIRLEERIRERSRIAQELHDTLLQGFQGIALRVQGVSKSMPIDDPPRKMMEEVLDRADDVMREARQSVRDLRRRATHENELPDRLAKFGEELSRDHAASLALAIIGTPRVLDPAVQDQAYRIAVEALTNAFRHASASKIETEITYDSSTLRIRVRDNGVGIDKAVLSNGHPDHWGLTGMRERAETIRADINIWSRQGAGTEMEIIIPASIAYPREEIRDT